jgi:hypothetical protein
MLLVHWKKNVADLAPVSMMLGFGGIAIPAADGLMIIFIFGVAQYVVAGGEGHVDHRPGSLSQTFKLVQQEQDIAM